MCFQFRLRDIICRVKIVWVHLETNMFAMSVSQAKSLSVMSLELFKKEKIYYLMETFDIPQKILWKLQPTAW